MKVPMGDIPPSTGIPAPPGKHPRRRKRRPGRDLAPDAPAEGQLPPPAAVKTGTEILPPRVLPPPPPPLPLETRVTRALQELSEVARELLKRQGVPRDSRHLPKEVSLPLTLPLVMEDLPQAGVQLLDELGHQLSRGVAGALAYQMGRVFCFSCGGTTCEHSIPPSRTDTFSHYHPTGRPEWVSFTNLCIDRGEDRVGDLYDDPPEVIAVVQDGGELTGRLLEGVNTRGIFELLGQVVVGLLPADLGPPSSEAERITLTLQFVETRGATPPLRLNLLGMNLDDIIEAATEVNPRGPSERLRRTILNLRAELDALGRKSIGATRRGEKVDVQGEITLKLIPLQLELERIFRASPHRTRHAHDRHLSITRPTSSAFNDARNASENQLFFDVVHSTVVVLGPRGRTHVFTEVGRHVTSLFLKPGDAERKQTRGRWRPLHRSEIDLFRRQILTPRG